MTKNEQVAQYLDDLWFLLESYRQTTNYDRTIADTCSYSLEELAKTLGYEYDTDEYLFINKQQATSYT